MENQYLIRHTSWKLVNTTVSTATRIVSSSSPKIERVSLNLTRDTITDKWVSDGQTRHRLPPTDPRPPRTKIITFPVNKNGVISSAVFKNTATILNTWLSTYDNHKLKVTNEIMTDMLRNVKSVNPPHNIELQLFYKVVVKQDEIMHVNYVTDWVMQQSLEGSAPRMVPASDSSIKSLRRTIVVDGDDDDDDDDDGGRESCSICFEDFLAGSEVSCLPCSHVYHQDCIGKWLTTSHYCPNCRYEMPTS